MRNENQQLFGQLLRQLASPRPKWTSHQLCCGLASSRQLELRAEFFSYLAAGLPEIEKDETLKKVEMAIVREEMNSILNGRKFSMPLR